MICIQGCDSALRFLHRGENEEKKWLIRKASIYPELCENDTLTIDISIWQPYHYTDSPSCKNHQICHHSRNCWPIRTQITSPKVGYKASRETKIWTKSVSQHQPVFLLQFGKTTALHFDSFHTASVDFKAKVKYRDRFVVCNWKLCSSAIGGQTWNIFQQVFLLIETALNPSRYVHYILH